ncbi:MAG: SEL1-like repeat protein, partial [Pyramidobacter sp.]|nr:SEL1-like repeat protein [Pyramidobacter sp.]
MTYADIIMLDNKVKYDNDVDAMLALGRAYAAGDGVARDKNMALEWLRKAALAGKAEALAEIEKLTAGGDNTS